MQLPFFVYGTLRAGESNATLLRGAIARTRNAKLSGAQMFDLGPYPMIIEAESTHEIWGELIEIEAEKYAAIVKSLDRLESVDGANPENPDALYRRLRRFVRVGEEQIEAWIYFGRERVARRGCIVAGGDWVKRFKNLARTEYSTGQ